MCGWWCALSKVFLRKKGQRKYLDIVSNDLGMKNSIIRELECEEVIFWHLAANLSFSSKDSEDVQTTNYPGTVNAVELANKVASKFTHMSTAYVCGSSSFFGEKELYKGQKFRNSYESSKIEAEKYVWDNCKLPFIIFRPSVIMGDAYVGKAEGCTFGYYRYAFMFHFLKEQVTKALEIGGVYAFILKAFGTSYDGKKDMLRAPWLILPYPKEGSVDMVPVDYVIDSMISFYERHVEGVAVHITHHNLPSFSSTQFCTI
jgi:hypothetical protein